MLLGVDVGGTFTDAVLVTADGRIVGAKSPTTPDDQAAGVMAAVRAVLARAGAEPSAVRAFAHGTTVATNALLEGRHARTVLVATEGFTDVVELGRQARASLYRLEASHPAPLVPPPLRVAAPERATPEGILRPLDDPQAVARAVLALEPEAVAVCLLHAHRHPQHERALGAALGDGVHVSLSHEVVGTFREFERAATTEIDAALSPLLGAYLRSLAGAADAAGLPEPAVMLSTGGVAELGRAAAHAALTLLSGPAGGAAGAALAARASGHEGAVGVDMGGTSCDVCVVQDGDVRERGGGEIAGRPVALPMLDLHTVGAGGGSLAWADAGGALRVGPRSAGARPGPAAYGHGGTEPTVTDANVVLGRLPAGATLGDGEQAVTLDAGAASRAVATLAERLGLAVDACAEGIVRVAVAEMARAIRVMTVERGIDPRPLALVACGGAGPLHGAQLAEELGMRTVLCPRTAGVLAALGLVAAEQRRDVQLSVLLSGAALDDRALRDAVGALAGRAGPCDELRATYALRYRGQAFELDVPAGPGASADELRDAFAAAHEHAYGYREETEIELVTIRVTAVRSAPVVELRAAGEGEPPDATSRDTSNATLRDTSDVPGSTVWVPPGWSHATDAAGTVVLTR